MPKDIATSSAALWYYWSSKSRSRWTFIGNNTVKLHACSLLNLIRHTWPSLLLLCDKEFEHNVSKCVHFNIDQCKLIHPQAPLSHSASTLHSQDHPIIYHSSVIIRPPAVLAISWHLPPPPPPRSHDTLQGHPLTPGVSTPGRCSAPLPTHNHGNVHSFHGNSHPSAQVKHAGRSADIIIICHISHLSQMPLLWLIRTNMRR